MKRRLPVILLLAPLGLVAQDRPAQAWEMAHPDAKILIGIDVQRIKASAVAGAFGPDSPQQNQMPDLAALAMAGPFAAQMGAQFPVMDFLKDIDRVLVSSSGTELPGTKQSSPFLIVLEGTFPPEHYQALLQGVKRTYRTVPVYRTSKTPNPANSSIAIVNEHMIVFGDERSVFSALDRRGRALPLGGVSPNPILARAAELAPTHDLWFIASGFPPSAPRAAAPGAPPNPMAALGSAVDTVEFAISARDGFTLDADLVTKDPTSAQLFASMVSAALAAQIANAQTPQAAELARKLQITNTGNRLEMHVALTKEEVQEQIRLAQEARARALANPPVVGPNGIGLRSSARPAEPVKPAGPRKVKIYGLDDGVKEIPLDHP